MTFSGLLDDDVLLAAPVRLEVIAGIWKREQAPLEHLSAALPILNPQGATWRLVGTWIKAATARGDGTVRFAGTVIDAGLIGAIHGHFFSSVRRTSSSTAVKISRQRRRSASGSLAARFGSRSVTHGACPTSGLSAAAIVSVLCP